MPVLAKGRTRTGRLWTYVRDDRPFGGCDPPAAAFLYSVDRGGAHAERHLAGWAGVMQADAYAGFGRLYEANRKPGPVVQAACWAHARRKLFELAQLQKAPIAVAAVQRIKLSAKNELAKAIDYSLKRWTALTRFLDDGRLCLSNIAAERALRGIAVGRHNRTFAGSDAGGERAAALYTLIETAKLNDIDPRAWLADVLARLQDHPAKRIAEPLP